MAYEPYNWTTASYVNPGNMNHLEQGVAGASTTAEKAASDITKTNEDLSDLSGVVTTLNSNLTNVIRYLQMKITFVGTLHESFASKFADMNDQEIRFYKNSNKPSDRPTGNDWGSAVMIKYNGNEGLAFSFANNKVCFSYITNGAIAGWLTLNN